MAHKSALLFFDSLISGSNQYFHMHLGERITQNRMQLRMSQFDLAKKGGTSTPIIVRCERDKLKPLIEVAAKIADVLNVTVDYLFTSNSMMADKKLLNRKDVIEAQPTEEKDKVYYFIDMALSHHKTKKAFAK